MKTFARLALIALAATLALPGNALAGKIYADTVLKGGKILTADKRFSVAQAVAIREGRFLAVGRTADIATFIGPNTKVIDLDGKTAVPGLMDTHTHFRAAGEALVRVNLKDAKTVQEALNILRDFAAKQKPGQWIAGAAWHPLSQLAEKRNLTRLELDSVAPNNPVYLVTVGHSSMANSLAFKVAGITKDTPNPEGGVIEKGPDGELNGSLVASALGLVAKHVPPYSTDELSDQFLKSMQILNTYGLTSTVDGGLTIEEMHALHRLSKTGKQTMRVAALYRPERVPTNLAEWERLMKADGPTTGFGDEWMRLAGVKLVIDGGMTLRTARTIEPYPDDKHFHGVAYVTPEHFRKLIRIADKYDWRVAVHTVGDLASQEALDAFEDLNKDSPIAGKRFVLIHASLLQRSQMQQAKRLGVRLDPQNVFMWDKAATVERFLGADRANRAVALRSMIEIMGIENVSGGTDFPANLINPFVNMYIMVTRKDPRGVVYGKDESVTREQALRMYTSSGPYYTFEEKLKGSIEPGKLADLAILSDDFMTVPEERIKDIRVLTTIVGGKVVYQR